VAGRPAEARPAGSESVYVIARGRLMELIAVARESLARLTLSAANESVTPFEAAWATSRAAGFLEAVTLVDLEHADELLSEFESVAALVENLYARYRSGVPAHEPEP